MWKERSEDPDQPHIVQLGAVLVDGDTREEIDSLDVIVKPEDWTISQEMTDIHGISHEQAMDEGIPEEDALEQFLELWQLCDKRIAHNTTFDNRIIRIAMKRYCPDLVSDDIWKDRSLYVCTLSNARKIMGGKDGHTLGEVYKHFLGKELVGAHNAMIDSRACLEIYFAMLDQGYLD
jgi:DNA polymerase III alpha subunit (gram-positive type)